MKTTILPFSDLVIPAAADITARAVELRDTAAETADIEMMYVARK